MPWKDQQSISAPPTGTQTGQQCRRQTGWSRKIQAVGQNPATTETAFWPLRTWERASAQYWLSFITNRGKYVNTRVPGVTLSVTGEIITTSQQQHHHNIISIASSISQYRQHHIIRTYSNTAVADRRSSSPDPCEQTSRWPWSFEAVMWIHVSCDWPASLHLVQERTESRWWTNPLPATHQGSRPIQLRVVRVSRSLSCSVWVQVSLLTEVLPWAGFLKTKFTWISSTFPSEQEQNHLPLFPVGSCWSYKIWFWVVIDWWIDWLICLSVKHRDWCRALMGLLDTDQYI